VKGVPSRAKTIQDIALMANVAWNMPAGMEAGLEASSFYDPPNFVYPFGAHVAVVEVDRETGSIELKKYVAVDDCGPQINPVIVEGQVHGGVVQGVGQALWEGAVYDESGQLLTGSMLDYALPRADALPDIDGLMTAPALIDIGRIQELKGIASGPTIRIGALTTHSELAASSVLRAGCPMLAEAAAQIADAQVRNYGTFGGNVAHADPASDLPT